MTGPVPAFTIDVEFPVVEDGLTVPLVVSFDGSAYHLEVPEGIHAVIGPAGESSVTASAAIGFTPALTALRDGPVRVLSLAVTGVYCLHAGAVLADDRRVVAFVGGPGSGKSTLARLLPELGGSRWVRVADDILPVRVTPAGVQVLPVFPQPRLRPEEQFRPQGAQPLFLEAVYFLGDSASPGAPFRCETLTPIEAFAVLAGGTMATRVFHRKLLADHAAFCRDVVAVVPVRSLSYPRTFNAVRAVAVQVTGDLGIAG